MQWINAHLAPARRVSVRIEAVITNEPQNRFKNEEVFLHDCQKLSVRTNRTFLPKPSVVLIPKEVYTRMMCQLAGR